MTMSDWREGAAHKAMLIRGRLDDWCNGRLFFHDSEPGSLPSDIDHWWAELRDFLRADVSFYEWAEDHIFNPIESLDPNAANVLDEVEAVRKRLNRLASRLRDGGSGSDLVCEVSSSRLSPYISPEEEQRLNRVLANVIPADASPRKSAPKGSRHGSDPQGWTSEKKLALLRYLLQKSQAQSRKAVIAGASQAGGGKPETVRRNLTDLAAHQWVCQGERGTCLTEMGERKARKKLGKT